jgi:hypothetical protein
VKLLGTGYPKGSLGMFQPGALYTEAPFVLIKAACGRFGSNENEIKIDTIIEMDTIMDAF